MKTQVVDKMDLRRKNLQLLKEQTGDEWQTVAKRVGMSASHLSQVLNGIRPFTEKTARNIEHKLNLSAGWLDLEHERTISGQSSQNTDAGLLTRVIAAIDGALKSIGKWEVRDSEKYGKLVEFVYEDTRQRGMPNDAWFTRLLRLILE